MFRQRRASYQAEVVKKEEKKYETPLDELTYLLDSLEEVVQKSKESYIESIQPPPPEPKNRRASIVDSIKKFRINRSEDDLPGTPKTPASASAPETPRKSASATSTAVAAQTPDGELTTPPPKTPKTPQSSIRSSVILGPKEIDAKFMPMSSEEVDNIVEMIRRISELVVIGERAAGNLVQHQDKMNKLAKEQHLGDDIMKEEEALQTKGRYTENDKYIPIFETFFERDGLALITNIVTGVSFDLKAYRAKQKEDLNLDKSERSEDLEIAEHVLQGVDLDEHDYMLLPPLPIATQAVQSVSILVQNVSRATSLFFILSNNHIDRLINFPLEQYHVAERKKHNQEANGMSPRRFGSPELAELTTHFISFLKSLALRMNTETLQFFLTYPTGSAFEEEIVKVEDTSKFSHNNPQDMDGDDHDRPLDEIESNSADAAIPNKLGDSPVSVKTVDVRFPLYERALEFCSAHQDSFVRVTAMNICLNTLRLATVRAENDGEVAEIDVSGSSPDGVLHNAKTLPIRERLAIAQYVCSPSRVERLASPIFTKLAQLWGILEEQFRDMDTVSHARMDTDSDKKGARQKAANGKVAKAKETARRQKITDAFNDTAYNVQDELLLLEDVLKVGLTSLNEQTIEMMFATFVYPLLLQPLLLYFQRSPVPDEVLFSDPLNDHSAGREINQSDLSASEISLISAPAKSAFFMLVAAFQFITNKPLLRLLFTALFHPLSPDVTGETMIRAKADVACMGPDGKVTIRIDPLDENGQMKTLSDRSTYIFGTVTGKKCFSGSSDFTKAEEDACVFVLSPALSEILEFRGDNPSVIARTRHNPYRRAIFKCFTLCSQLSDLRPLSVLAVDSAVSVFDEKFVADIFFGLDLKKFEDHRPIDERTSDSRQTLFDDREMGGPLANESRMTLGTHAVGYDHMTEVLSSFRSCLMKAVPGGNGTWKLEYDSVCAHALLSAIRGNQKALQDTAKGIDRRCRQAAAFLADVPQSIAKINGEKEQNEAAGEKNDDEKVHATVMDMIFRGGSVADSASVVNDLIELKRAHRVNDKPGHSVSITYEGSYTVLCSRCCSFPPLDNDGAESALRDAMGSARAWVKLDALSTLLNGLVPTEAEGIRHKILGGLAAKGDGSVVETNDSQTVYAPISEFFWDTLFEEDRDGIYIEARPGTVVSLVGHTAFPCVCEVPPSSAPLFSEVGAKVVSQGITWQSLYLVILGRNLVLAEPERRSVGNGRVVTCCKLERLAVERDPADARADTSARRLILSHIGPDTSPPGLFLFEETPSVKDEGPFVRVRQYRSSLDVWFEDSKAVSLAFGKVDSKIAAARTYRGHRIRTFLAQGEGSGYPMNMPLYRPQPVDTI